MSAPVMPVEVSVALTHAEVQAIAEDARADLLHIKGPALDESLRRPWPDADGGRRFSIDADVLVRPSHAARLAQALRASGWRCVYDFADDSAFEHAATWARPDLANLDVHRFFPGVELEPEHAFDILWAERVPMQIAGLTCDVPNLAGQRLFVIIHAARGQRERDVADRHRAWVEIDEAGRQDVENLAERLGATVALFAGTGRLEDVKDRHGYALWRHLTNPESSDIEVWWARVRAAPNMRSAVRIGWRLIVPNVHRLEVTLGRPATAREVAQAYARRLTAGLHSLHRAAARRRHR